MPKQTPKQAQETVQKTTKDRPKQTPKQARETGQNKHEIHAKGWPID